MSRKLGTFDVPSMRSRLIKMNNLKNIENYSVQVYLDILKKLNILEMAFKKKYFIRKCDNQFNNTKGAVLKRIYSFNPIISSWRLPDFGE